MCGHVGIAGKLAYSDEAIMKRLLVFDYFRGMDSTGIAALYTNGDSAIAKVASHPLDLFDMNRFKSTLSGHRSMAIIGHNRAATRGVVNTVNAHPYEYGHIIGAMNGTLEPSSHRALEDLCDDVYDVDSQAVFAAIAKVGIEETVKVLQGAWALVWIDTDKGTLNFLRNNQRPFWIAYTEGFNKIIWASEYPTISAAISNEKTFKLEADVSGYSYHQTEVNKLYTIDLTELRAGSESRPDPVVCELKGKEPVVVTTYKNPFPTTGVQGTGGKTTSFPGKTTTESGVKVGDNIIPFNKPIEISGDKSALDGVISLKDFNELAKYGCSWCQADIDYDDVGILVNKREDLILCKECAGHPTQTRIYAS